MSLNSINQNLSKEPLDNCGEVKDPEVLAAVGNSIDEIGHEKNLSRLNEPQKDIQKEHSQS